MTSQTVSMLPVLGLLAWAAAEDFRTRRIRNWLTGTLTIAGILHSYIAVGGIPPAQAWLGLAAGFALMFPQFALRALRGGDVKLMAGIGAWFGPVGVLKIFVIQAIVGLVIVLVQCTWQGKLIALFRNSAVLAVNLVHISDLGARHVIETGRSFRSIDRPLPYAVPVLAATLIVVAMSL
jgi:prepilin peptidase CpaA